MLLQLEQYFYKVGLRRLTNSSHYSSPIWSMLIFLLCGKVFGPGIQDDQDIGELLSHPHAFLWFLMLLAGMTISTIFMVHKVYEEKVQIMILLIARSTSYTLNLTVSRAFLLNPSYFILVTFVIIKIVSGAIYTYAIVVQSTTVTQSKFVPLNATTIILVNALTGVIIWQDWRVVSII